MDLFLHCIQQLEYSERNINQNIKLEYRCVELFDRGCVIKILEHSAFFIEPRCVKCFNEANFSPKV